MADLVAYLTQLGKMLDDLHGREVTVVVKPTSEQIDAIHAGLLRKQQSGSLGLNK